ncbi:MAG: STAS domain-containing protein [Proteobacteria bacterium]|nr:STAS domain-containing protein [Pseudomonadota bacterium]
MAIPKGNGKLLDKVQNALNGEQQGERVISSGDRLTIATIADFAQQLRSGLAEAGIVAVEFSEIVEMDVTALQVFCSACRTASAAGKKFICRDPLPATLLHLAAAAGSERLDYCEIDNPSCFRKFGGLK